MDTPLISVIIVTYNTRQMTLDCLHSLALELGEMPSEVWVVDNASSDGTVEAIRTTFPQVKLIANQNNRGFGAANNLALQQAAGQYLLLLNSDAFLSSGALTALLTTLRANPDLGAVGPRLLNADGTLQLSCFRFPSPFRAWMENLGISAVLSRHPFFTDYRRWPHDQERRVEFISGACMLVRREAYRAVGGFDERFFLYAEETDWQRRMRQLGWQIAFTPAAVAVHLGGASGVTDRPKINRVFFESLDYYVWKHHGIGGLVSVRLAMLVGCFVRAVAWASVLILIPKRRVQALSKARLMVWLCLRQATYWRLAFRQPPAQA